MNGYTGVVKCIKPLSGHFTTGRLYEIINGVIVTDTNSAVGVVIPFRSVDQLNKYFSSQFIEVESNFKLEDGDKVKYRNGTYRLVLPSADSINDVVTGARVSGISYFRDDLTHKGDYNFDIVEVYRKDKLVWKDSDTRRAQLLSEIEGVLKSIQDIKNQCDEEINKLTKRLNDLKGRL